MDRGHGMWGTISPVRFELRELVPGGGRELHVVVRRWQGEPAETGCGVVRGVVETVEAVCAHRPGEGWRCGDRVVASGEAREERLFDDECSPAPWQPPAPWRVRLRFDRERVWQETVEGEPPEGGPWSLDAFFPIPED